MEPNTFQTAWIWFAALTFEAVIVCTPEDAHVDYCLEAIRLGKAVLVEKPISHTVESAEEISRAARQERRHLNGGPHVAI